MKIRAIGTSINITNKLNQNYNKQITFGVGEDYGNDEFLEQHDYQPQGSGNTLGYITAMARFALQILKERTNCTDPEDNGWDDPDTDPDIEPLTDEPTGSVHPEEEIC